MRKLRFPSAMITCAHDKRGDGANRDLLYNISRSNETTEFCILNKNDKFFSCFLLGACCE